jgi:hypothetical protein
MVQRSTDGGIGEYSMQQQRLSVVSGKKKERKRRRGGWLAEPKWWAARAFELSCNAKEITG